MAANEAASTYVTVAQAAAELKITGRAVRHRIEVGTLAAEKIGDGRTSAYLIPREEIERAKAAAA